MKIAVLFYLFFLPLFLNIFSNGDFFIRKRIDLMKKFKVKLVFF